MTKREKAKCLKNADTSKFPNALSDAVSEYVGLYDLIGEELVDDNSFDLDGLYSKVKEYEAKAKPAKKAKPTKAKPTKAKPTKAEKTKISAEAKAKAKKEAATMRLAKQKAKKEEAAKKRKEAKLAKLIDENSELKRRLGKNANFFVKIDSEVEKYAKSNGLLGPSLDNRIKRETQRNKLYKRFLRTDKRRVKRIVNATPLKITNEGLKGRKAKTKKAPAKKQDNSWSLSNVGKNIKRIFK